MFKALSNRFWGYVSKRVSKAPTRYTKAVANFSEENTDYTLMSENIESHRGRIVKRNQYWLNENTQRIHVVSMNYRTPHETVRQDLNFSPWDTGRSYDSVEAAKKDQPFTHDGVLDELASQGIRVVTDDETGIKTTTRQFRRHPKFERAPDGSLIAR
jgi:hypothetical protein